MEPLAQLGKYRLLKLLATGGMGEVFLARAEGPAGFQKTVVIKRILKHLANDPAFVTMFLNEARLAAVLSHPNIVQIFELGEIDGQYFIAMEYIRGRSLRAIRQKLLERKQVFSPVLAARLCSHALSGLHYAHTLTDDAGQPLHVVHRDISPDNILVTVNGMVKLVDFGIAKAANAISTTRTGTVKGKYAYMSPEQLTGGAVDARTDVYAMGILLYEMLTGVRPYAAPSEPALIHAVLSTQPAPPRDRNPGLPQALNDLILKAIEKDPAARFESAEDMANALEGFIVSTGQTLTGTHCGNFVKDLFGDEIRFDAVGMMTPHPGPLPMERSSKPEPRPDPRPRAATVPMHPALKSAEPVTPPTEIAHSTLAMEPSALPKRRKLIAPLAIAVVLLGGVTAAYFAGRNAAPPVDEGVAKQPPVAETKPTDVPVPTPPEQPKPAEIARQMPEQKEPAAPVVEPMVPVAAKSPAPKPTPSPEPPKVERRTHHRVVARPTEPGKVALRVNPWAEVYFEGKSLGITPMAPVTVPAGRQTFTLKNSDIGVTRKVTVVVPSGGQTILKADLFE